MHVFTNDFKYDVTPRFQNGWSVFARENNLKVGDLCVFELINRNELTFEVVFFHATEAKKCSSSAGHGGGAIDQVEIKRRSICKVKSGYEHGEYTKLKISDQVTQTPSRLKASRVLEAANNFIPKNPFFRATLGPTSKTMHVPVKFAMRFPLRKAQTATLQVGERFWPVNLIGYTNERRQMIISGGWLAFAEENSLRTGDVCTFELVETNDIVLKVHTFRS